MSVRTTGSVLVVFVCCVKMTFTSQKICALKGSTVELSCSYSYSRGYTVRANGWYSKNKNSHWTKIQDTDSGLVSHHGNKKNDCTLRITDVREEHSTSYCFGYTLTTYLEKECSPVTLAVTELQVTVSRSYPYKLTCSTTCTLPGNPTYIWYRNGQHIDESTSPQYKYSVYSNYENSYSCAVKGHEDLHSPVVCIQGQRCSRVIYTKRRICVLKGSSVDISCTYDGYNDVRSSLWFSTKQSSRWRDTFTPKDLTTEPGFVGRVEYPYQESRRYSNSFTLRINNVREEDSAEYRFTFNTYHFKWGNSLPGTTLTVTDVVLEMDHASVSEGDRVTLTCRTKCTLNPIPEYIWYKNRQTIENSNNYSTTLKFSVTSEDSGRYSCAVKGHEDIRSTEENLTVRYAPKKTSVSVSPSGEIVEGSSVTLTCSSDANPPVYKYTWYKKNVTSPKASGQSYSITNITSDESGKYYCEAENKYGRLNSSLVFLTVLYNPKNTSVSVSPSGEIVEGSSVTLICSSDANPPVNKYTWYKKNVISPKATGQNYSITNITSEESGEYYCEAENEYGRLNSSLVFVTVLYNPKNTSVSVSPSGEIVEGSSVTLTCSSDANPPADKYTWYKKNVASPKASGQSYTITNITSEASGEYYCEAENKYGCLHSLLMLLDILYGPRMPLLSVSPSGEIVEGSSVTLTCSSDASPPVYKYTWYKKNVASPKASGQSYNITNIRSEDSGEYYCEAENQRASMNSTTLLIALAGRQTSVRTRVVVITGVVLVLILCLFGFAWFWINASKITSDKRNTRNTAENGQGESSPVYDNIACTLMDSTAGQTADTDNQDAILYTNIFLSCPGNQDVPLYSTVQLPQHQKKSVDVQYTTLKFNCPSASSRPAAQTTEEDASMIYSTVNKHRGPVTWRKEMRP
ncbi:hypothetical protein UPYG_G00060460 [Umbra pygmaea]|uniref:B-cell receptor CD22 n=1 Tax=Umbra pygmaea TaxID=75934 RepID=A0ABD0X9G6_UMBPY